MIGFTHKGDLKKTEKYLNTVKQKNYMSILDKYGRIGVQQLSTNTPVATGLTAASWDYEIVQGRSKTSILWKNSNIKDGVSIAIILQYGHGTGSGGYVQGTDYINPAMRSVFEKVADELWMEVVNA